MTLNKEETHLYTCKYCKIEFKPTRRRVQKFCSDNCRSKNWFMVHSKGRSSPIAIESTETGISLKGKKKKNKKTVKKETINPVSIGNAALGVAAVDALKFVFTKEDDKLITKKEFKLFKSELLGRYHSVLNADPDEFGRKPYYDIETKSVVYTGSKNPFKK